MKPIKRGLMPHTATIYNVWKDPDTGKNQYFRTVIEQARFMYVSSSVNVASIGWTRVVSAQLLIDPVTSSALEKAYAERGEWAAMNAEGREAHWTLQEGDYVVQGECPVTIPPGELSDLTEKAPLKISAILPVLDRSGDVHHWEITLV